MLHAILGVVAVQAVPAVARAAGAAAAFAGRGRQAAGEIGRVVALGIVPIGPGVAAAVGGGALALPEVLDAVAAEGHRRDGPVAARRRLDVFGVERDVDRSDGVVVGVAEEQAEGALVRRLGVAELLGDQLFVQALERLDQSADGCLGLGCLVGIGHEQPVALGVEVDLADLHLVELERDLLAVDPPEAAEAQRLAGRLEGALDVHRAEVVEVQRVQLVVREFVPRVAGAFGILRPDAPAAIAGDECESDDAESIRETVGQTHHLPTSTLFQTLDCLRSKKKVWDFSSTGRDYTCG